MIVDTSALVAILREEPDAQHHSEALANAPVLRMSAATYLELSIVIDGNRNPELSSRLDRLIEIAKIEIVPFTPAQARAARQAYREFGRGSGHPARLNFGDCFAYALASETSEPLLFKGNDFIHTGIKQA